MHLSWTPDGRIVYVSQESGNDDIWIMNADGTGRKRLTNDPSIDAGWGGEAFGTGKAAMVIEGNWIAGAMTNDFPDVKYVVAELPEGPAGPGTIQYTNCWGMAALSDNIPGATSLVEFLTSTESQLAAAEAFGVMPSVASAGHSRRSGWLPVSGGGRCSSLPWQSRQWRWRRPGWRRA